MSGGTRSGGIGILSVVGVVFVTLKMVDKIDWPWVWVLSPFWIPFALFLVVIAVMLFVMVLAAILGANPRMTITKRR